MSDAVLERDRRIIRIHSEWLRRANKSDRTIEARSQLMLRLATELPDGLLRATDEHLADWQLRIRDTRSLSTCATYSSHVKAWFGWCVDEGHLDVSPARRLPIPPVPRGSGRPISDEDFELARACSVEPITTWLVIGRFMGLRACEIARIEREHVYPVGRRLVLRGIGKGNKPFKMPVPEDVRPYLEGQMRGKHGRLWFNTVGRPVTAAYVSKALNGFLHGIGLPDTCHQLRHGYGTHLWRESKDAVQVQRGLRHSSFTTCQIYIEEDMESLAETMDQMAAPLRVVRDEPDETAA